MYYTQELEEDPEFQRIVKTRYGQRPLVPVSMHHKKKLNDPRESPFLVSLPSCRPQGLRGSTP